MSYPHSFEKAWVTGFLVNGFGLIVQLHWHPRIQINTAKVYNDVGEWENLLFETSYICANVISVKLKYSGSSLTSGKCYLIELAGTIN